MESNWRWNISRYGLGGKWYAFGAYTHYYEYFAELSVPYFVGGLWVKYLAQARYPTYRVWELWAVPVLTSNYPIPFISAPVTGSFPGTWSVVAD